jgi:hypothetical protein
MNQNNPIEIGNNPNSNATVFKEIIQNKKKEAKIPIMQTIYDDINLS